MKFRKLEYLFESFHYDYLMKRMISMRLITKKIQGSKKKFVWDALGTLIKGSRKIFKIFVFYSFYGGVYKNELLSTYSAF